VIYARLREISEDGRLGPYGPTSKISTLLAAPSKLAAKEQEGVVRLTWKMAVDVPGFEVRISNSPEFKPNATKILQTNSQSIRVPKPETGRFFWNVQATQSSGKSISAISKPAEAKMPSNRVFKVAYQKPAAVKKADLKSRGLASIPSSTIELMEPAEDAVLLGALNSKEYGRLKWKDPDHISANSKTSYIIEISTDRDFIQIVERGSTKGTQYQLQGDLPEGSLFWRVKRKSGNQWSSARRLELIYE
jgi:hypothetical protein